VKAIISTCDGKYKTENNNGILTVLRHNKPWDRNFKGDSYVLSLVQKIEDIEEEKMELLRKLYPSKWHDVNEYYEAPEVEWKGYHNLRNCPFCGGIARVEELQDCVDNTLSYVVQCVSCKAETTDCISSEMAVLNWNNRMIKEIQNENNY
jgi:hypothetical protein